MKSILSRVYKDEEGHYGTIPDGDNATLKEIIEFEIENE